MKMTKENFTVLQVAIKKAHAQLVVKPPSTHTAMRQRWDLLWISERIGALPTSFICTNLYKQNDLNDTHIDTALRQIVSSLGAQ